MISVPRLVVILDREQARGDLADVALATLSGGADQIQSREPGMADDEYRRLIESLLRAGVPHENLTVNAHPGIASDLGLNLHLPERLADEHMQKASERLTSRSVHGPVNASRFDYVIAGNALETTSKPGKAGIGVEGMRNIVIAANAPVLAVGGMTPETLGLFMSAGAHGVAVRSYITSSPDPESAARAIRREIDAWMI